MRRAGKRVMMSTTGGKGKNQEKMMVK